MGPTSLKNRVVNYARPNGISTREGAIWVKVANKEGRCLLARALKDASFVFSALPSIPTGLLLAKRRPELPENDRTRLTLLRVNRGQDVWS